MHKSDSISNLAVALAKAQAELPAVKENSTNPFLKSRFADLGAVIQTARPVLAKHDLAISQFAVGDGERIGVETMILHASGEWMADVLYLPLEEEKGKSRAQAAGSIVTYLRRYSLSAILGMYSGEDTDGHIPPSVKPMQTLKPVAQEFAEEQVPFALEGTPIVPPLPDSKPLPPPVSIPSKQNGGNSDKKDKTPLVPFPLLLGMLVQQANKSNFTYSPEAREGARGAFVGKLTELAGDTDKYHQFINALFPYARDVSGRVSSKQVDDADIRAVLNWANSPSSKSDVAKVVAAYLVSQGQVELFAETATA